MIGTYTAAVATVIAAGAIGQAILSLCGRRRWSWLAPAVGLAALQPLAWLAVRLPGEGTAALVVLTGVIVVALIHLLSAGRVEGMGDAWRMGWPVALLALALASLPFIVEGRFGVLGTGLNPDMSQHLFAADRLGAGGSERLIAEGYPLAPHALAVGLDAGGISLVHAFGGITLATAVVTCLAPMVLLERLTAGRRLVCALLVGLAYMSAAYLTQGAFKETMLALFLLAFALALGELAAGRLVGAGLLRAVPLAVLAAGAAHVYSFPGLIWLAGATVVWAAAELGLAARAGPGRPRALIRASAGPAAVALGALAVLVAPELGRFLDFASFETFDPDGAGLGNLFNPLSPLEALGIWPSGDFRLDAGAGFAPASAFWLGGLVAAVALGFGLWWWLRRRELAVPSAFVAAALLVVYANAAGTPYQEAKAIALAAPLAMLISTRGLAEATPSASRLRRILGRRGLAGLRGPGAKTARRRVALSAFGVVFVVAAGGCSLLALANGPVGPSSWSPDLLERKPLPGATLVLASEDYLTATHGRDFIIWELRGGDVCVETDPGPRSERPPPGISQVLVLGNSSQPPFEGTDAGHEVGDFVLWGIPEPTPGDSDCPFIADGARAAPGESDQ